MRMDHGPQLRGVIASVSCHPRAGPAPPCDRKGVTHGNHPHRHVALRSPREQIAAPPIIQADLRNRLQTEARAGIN